MTASKTFEQVGVWQKAHHLVLNTYGVTSKFPREELFGLTSQLRRAIVSVPANITEGFIKRSRKDKARYYNIAEGSLEECRYYFILARDLGYADTTAHLQLLEEVSRMLRSYCQAMMGAR